MADFETLVNNACDAKEIPGCVMTATDRDGAFKYAKAFGTTSPIPEKAKPMELNSVMWIASCTKLMTSLCAMQLVERGLVTLDEPVYKHIPELESYPVIKKWTDAGEPIEEKHTKPITLRTLLTHTSGFAYEFTSPKAMAYCKYHNRMPSSSGKLLERFNCPLLFEPGDSWAYGPGIDYAGLLIERITKQRLEEYMKENLWGPVGISDMTFFLSERPDMAERLVDMSERDAESGNLKLCTWPKLWEDGEGKEITSCLGGQGVFMAGDEYIKVLKAVLECDNGGEGKILSKASVEELFRPQLGEESKKALAEVLKDPSLNNNLGDLSVDQPKDYGLGGVLLMDDGPEKKAGTMAWGGYPNLSWSIDRKTGYAGIYANQILPLGDEKVCKTQQLFSKTMYERLEKQRADAKL